MVIKSVQKVIKIGSSAGVTIPAKDFKYLGVAYGEDIEVTFKRLPKPQEHTEEVVALTQRLIRRHQSALKNLNQR